MSSSHYIRISRSTTPTEVALTAGRADYCTTKHPGTGADGPGDDTPEFEDVWADYPDEYLAGDLNADGGVTAVGLGVGAVSLSGSNFGSSALGGGGGFRGLPVFQIALFLVCTSNCVTVTMIWGPTPDRSPSRACVGKAPPRVRWREAGGARAPPRLWKRRKAGRPERPFGQSRNGN